MDITGITDCATSISAYYDNLDRLNALRTLQDNSYDEYEHKRALFQTLTAINALESIRFYSAFAVFFNYGENSLMQGNAKILQLIARDESLHVGLTSQLLKNLVTEDPDYAAIKEETDSLHIYQEVIQQEIDWVKYIFSKGSILGLNESMLSDYIYYLGRQKVKTFLGTSDSELGFPVVKSNPLPWMDTWLNTGSMQVAPQEIEQINYQSGIIDTTNVGKLTF
jgi:ribonucleoside-diphosphate reductase beta chain